MSRFFKKYLPFIRAGVQSAVAYRTDFFFHIIGSILACFIMYFLWRAVFLSSNQAVLEGFTQNNMVMYIFVSFFSEFMIGCECHWNIATEINDGSIAMRILKPVSFNMTYLFQDIGFKIATVLFMFIPLVGGIEIYRTYISGTVQFNILSFSIYFFSVILAYLINFYFSICFGFTAFVLKYFWGTNILKICIVRFLSGAMVPLAFFPSGFRNVLEVLPFASLSYTPVMIYSGLYTSRQTVLHIGLQIFWLVFFYLLSKMIWSVVIKRLCVQGG